MTISREQCRAARALLGWSQQELEAATAQTATRVTTRTIASFEAGNRIPYERTLVDIRAALEAGGVIFLDSNGEGAGVRFSKDKQ